MSQTGRTAQRSWLAFVCAVVVLHACLAVGPDYQPPVVALPASWQGPLVDGSSAGASDEATILRWWSSFGDRQLGELIARALLGNRDLAQARARVLAARAQRGITRAGYFPTFDSSAEARLSRQSQGNGGGLRDSYAVGFDASWEIDLFGSVRRASEAATANLQASEEQLRDTQVSLLAEVALNYLELRTLQERLRMLATNIAAQQETFELARTYFLAGLSDELALQQATYNLANARAQEPSLRAARDAAQNRLAVLLGEQPGRLHQELSAEQPIPQAAESLTVGVPADLLRRRPDIRQAERELAAQSARVGVATAELYPRLTLGGSLGLEALSPAALGAIGSLAAGIGPRLSLPIFRAGALRKQIAVQSALQEQALARYEARVLAALEEVENTLFALAQERQRHRELQLAVQAAEQAVLLSRDKYAGGLIDFGAVLDAQRSLLSLQDQLTSSSGALSLDLVRLYKALGGGWDFTETGDS